MEESLSLEELMSTLAASREKEHRHNKFMAALKGIDLDEGAKRAKMEKVVEEMERLEAEREGKAPTPQNNEKNDLSSFGIMIVEEGFEEN